MKNLLLALLLISPVSFADFSCEVKGMKMLNDDGSLTTPPNPWRVGDVFVVDKLTGDVTGSNAPMLDMTVLYVVMRRMHGKAYLHLSSTECLTQRRARSALHLVLEIAWI